MDLPSSIGALPPQNVHAKTLALDRQAGSTAAIYKIAFFEGCLMDTRFEHRDDFARLARRLAPVHELDWRPSAVAPRVLLLSS